MEILTWVTAVVTVLLWFICLPRWCGRNGSNGKTRCSPLNRGGNGAPTALNAY